MKKTSGLVVFALMLAMLLIGGCGEAKKEQAAAVIAKRVVVTYVPAPLNVPSIVEKTRKSFETAYKAQGLAFDYSTITSGADQTAALASGDIHFLNCVGGSSVLLAAANGADIKILSAYSAAPKAFKMFSKDGAIKSPADLKGKTIAGPKGTILHELLAAYLKQGGLSMKDVKLVSMGLPQARAALEGGSVDAALLAGPLAYTAEKQGLHVVTDGTGLVSGLTLTATSGRFYKDNKPLVDTFLKVQKETLAFIKANHKEAVSMTAKATDLPETAVEEMFGLYDFNSELTPELLKSLQETQQFLLQSGMLEKQVDINKLLVK